MGTCLGLERVDTGLWLVDVGESVEEIKQGQGTMKGLLDVKGMIGVEKGWVMVRKGDDEQ